MKVYGWLLTCVLSSTWSGTPTLAESYRIVDLGTLGGSETTGFQINASGQVTGYARLSGDMVGHAFLWDGITLRDLGPSADRDSYGSAINASGQVAGYVVTADGMSFHVMLWDGTSMQDLGTLGGKFGQALAINDAGQSTGGADGPDCVPLAYRSTGTMLENLDPNGIHSWGADINSRGEVAGFARVGGEYDADLCQHGVGGEKHAIVWGTRSTRDLGPMDGRHSEGLEINDAGQVAGHLIMNPATVGISHHPFFWTSGMLMDLGTLGGTNAYVADMNESGHVVGSSQIVGDITSHAFLWDGTSMRDIATLGGYSVARAINASSLVVGDYGSAPGVPGGAFLSDGISMRDLIGLVHPNDPLLPHVILTNGFDINDRGQILANGTDNRTGYHHAYILEPIVAPYPFAGFFAPVDNPPTRNAVKAGSAVPIKFSLGGDRGLLIFATGYPISRRISCESSSPIDQIEETVTAGSSELRYASGEDQYHYVWKTDDAWAGTCRQFVMRLYDQTERVANFQFK